MRVLASTTAGTGHFLPMVPVLAACAEAGHEVLVACPESFASSVVDAGFDVAPFDDAPPDQWGPVMSRLPGLPPDEANRIVVGEIFGRIDTTAALPRLTATVEDWRPDLVLRDPTEFASWLLVRRLALQTARVSIGLLSLDAEWAGVAAASLGELPAAAGVDCSAASLAGGHALAAAPAVFDPPDQGAGVAVHRFRGPVPPEGRPATIPQGDDPLVYVTFGTVAAKLGVWPGLYRAALDGLADLPVRVLLTTGAEVDAADLGPLPRSVAVERFVPQDAVLRHADVMVTHGGFGTVLGGVRAGVPMVVAPLFADQPYNAERVAAMGAGVTVPTSLDPGAVPEQFPKAVRAAVQQCLDDPSYRSSSRALAEAMGSHPPVESVVSTLEAIAQRGG